MIFFNRCNFHNSYKDLHWLWKSICPTTHSLILSCITLHGDRCSSRTDSKTPLLTRKAAFSYQIFQPLFTQVMPTLQKRLLL